MPAQPPGPGRWTRLVRRFLPRARRPAPAVPPADPGTAPSADAAASATGAAVPVDPAAPRVLPLVIRIERADPPARTDALEAAALGVLTMLTDPRSGEAGEWADAVRGWQAGGRIAKVVRRARGAGWQRAAALDGIAVRHRTAELRVYPPVPVDSWPADLARLQVGGTELTDPAPPDPPPPGTAVLWLAPDLEMTAGKAMAQVGHAAQVGWWALDRAGRAAWVASGFALAVRTADAAQWSALLAAGLPSVRDAGFTEVAPGSCTAVADLPWLRRGRAGRRGRG